MDGNGQTVSNGHRGRGSGNPVVPSPREYDDSLRRLWAYGESIAAGDEPADLDTGLVSLAFIKAAIRRATWLWCTFAIAGFLMGLGLYLAIPPSYQASTTLFMTHGPYESSLSAAGDEAALARTRAVASLALHQLGLRQSASSFVGTYVVTPVSGRMLTITASAQSGRAAVQRANAVAAAFLRFRAKQLEAELKLMVSSLGQQFRGRPADANALSAEIRQQGAATTAAIQSSTVLDTAVPIPDSQMRRLLIYTVTGLVVGLMLGMGIAVVRAVTSDRLRQRDDVARALGAPVRMSTGKVHKSRWRPDRRGLRAARHADVRRIVAHLDSVVRPGSPGTPALAVIPADDPWIAAVSVTALGLSAARQGKRVVVADLCSTRPVARLLRIREPGVREAQVEDTNLVLAVPGRDDIPCDGPRAPWEGHRPGPAAELPGRSAFIADVTTECASADLILTLADLDPSRGGEHLATWAADAVVIVTAGRSSWTKVHAVGEMIRLAGTRLVSAVLIGADKTDESLGAWQAPAGGNPPLRSASQIGAR